jgi:hypothetical protein
MRDLRVGSRVVRGVLVRMRIPGCIVSNGWEWRVTRLGEHTGI